MDGVDGSTTFTDSALTPKTVTAVGNAQIDTAQSKFGGASGLFDGTGDYLTAVDSADWNFTGDFTIDLWARFSTLPTSGNRAIFVQQREGGNGWAFRLNNTAGVYSMQIIAFPAGSTIVNFSGNVTVATGEWHHYAVVLSGTTYALYFDGTNVGGGTDTDKLGNIAAVLSIGADNLGPTDSMNGHFDELRISNGIARWTANFTPPASAYTT